MKNILFTVFLATKTIFTIKWYEFLFCGLTLFSISVYIVLPVVVTSEIPLSLQLNLLTTRDYVSFIILS